jgi:selenide,water dikinase
LLVGRELASDAGVYKVRDDLALVQSVDFFTPIVNDPYEFGQIAAANSLSDLYAMGARPLTALNIVCFPSKEASSGVLKQILLGGIDKVHEAGAVLVGGHSVDDVEPKYGLSVTGVVHPDRFVSNSGAQAGDRLVLTKPIGTGILATVFKAGLLSPELLARMVGVMKALNREASEAMMEIGVSAATDITGFGLAGHALEMAQASKVRLFIEAHRVPRFPEAVEFLLQGFVPEGDYANKTFCRECVKADGHVERGLLELLYDAQTSGGLLIAVPEQRADALLARMLEKGLVEMAVVGWVEAGAPGITVLP